MAAMVAEFFAPEEMTVLNGDAELARAFTALPFDHLCFTGSTPVGRIVAQAAAQNLTPVTLELGGNRQPWWTAAVTSSSPPAASPA